MRRRRIRVWMIAATTAAATVWATPLTAHARNAATGSCGDASQRIVLTKNATLDPACTYTGGFDIAASHVALDCAGALVQAPVGTSLAGVRISTPVGTDLDAVTVRNCRFDGWFNNVHIARVGVQSLPKGHEYDHHLSGVTIEDSTLTGSHGVGLYVNAYVTDTTLRGLTIVGSGSTGIYLD